MAAVTTTDLKLKFGLENGKTTTLSLRNPKPNLTMTQVSDITETMVSKEFLIVGGSPIAYFSEGYIQSVTRTELA